MPKIEKVDFDQAKAFIKSDIEREIQLAVASEPSNPTGRKHLTGAGVNLGGGNFIAALGLLCYTEFFGGVRFNHRQRKDATRAAAGDNFKSFFDAMGPGYVLFQATHNVYGLFRCGMAHQYNVKSSSFGIGIGRNPSGIGIACNSGSFLFYVQSYYEDLMAAVAAEETKITFPVTLPDH